MRAPKRLIEVDLPIRRISAHARREKSIRHGHISTLHIWWARRPLAACRAVLCAALWPDPADPDCPAAFRSAAIDALTEFGKQVVADPKLFVATDAANRPRWVALGKGEQKLKPADPGDLATLRGLLLDFIAEFANWDNSTATAFLDTARQLTQSAHEALGGEPGTRPLVADPFAGGGSIPLEALRVGADAFASDLNPVAVLLNKVVLEYIPKYGQRLADEIQKWGKLIKEKAEKELTAFYPKDPDGSSPIAYLWARTIICEGPGCGVEVPLLRSLWLARKGERSVALRLVRNQSAKRIDFEIIQQAKVKDVTAGTVKKGSATCPYCGYTTPVKAVRAQLVKRHGGAADARLYCVVLTKPKVQGRFYRLPTVSDLDAVRAAITELNRRKAACVGSLSLVPDEPLDVRGIRHTWAMIYGLRVWGDLFTPRQQLAMTSLAALVREAGTAISRAHPNGLGAAVQVLLALCVNRVADLSNSLCGWKLDVQCPTHLFARQAVPMVWDFSEAVVTSESSGSISVMAERLAEVLKELGSNWGVGTSVAGSAVEHQLPDESVPALFTDPPYYDAVPYAYLSDFFYVWFRRSLANLPSELLHASQVPKDEEIVVDRPHELSESKKDIAFYETELTKAFGEARRILKADGVCVIVFASKTTSSWEAILQAVVRSRWTITGSWPIDTEMETRLSAQRQARLASSVHLVCRPRTSEVVGDWRDVLAELPVRIHQWMPRLADEGVVGADAIFACLGPALEIYSQYVRVEKATGEPVALREYLEQVWAAVAKEALSMILRGGDAAGFEEDARLSVIWFWVLKSANGEKNGTTSDEAESDDAADDEADEGTDGKPEKVSGWQMEYDAVRKLAQGLGADLTRLSKVGGIIAINGKLAVLRTVESRQSALLGVDRAKKAAEPAPVEMEETLFGPQPKAAKKVKRVRKPKEPTVTMKAVENRREALTDEPTELPGLLAGMEDTRSLIQRMVESGTTVLDRLHQTMLLFGLSQTALLGPFLSETRMGSDVRFWRLAQALSALYPAGTEEKRWVDGVLSRKKGLGF